MTKTIILNNEDKLNGGSIPMVHHEVEGDISREPCTSPKPQINGKSYDVKKAGPYILGPMVKTFWDSPFTMCLATRAGSEEHYLMKILVLNDSEPSFKSAFHRRTQFHSEQTTLSMLSGMEGIVRLHETFCDLVVQEGTGNTLRRMCMVTECFVAHADHNPEMVLLTFYIKEKKRLEECEALTILWNLLRVLHKLHQINFVHGDLKATNIVVNRRTLEVKLVNIYHGKLWSKGCETPPLNTPDIIIARCRRPKSYDMWSLGVVLYTMVHGCLPFLNNTISLNMQDRPWTASELSHLYEEMMNMDYIISSTIRISEATKKLINGLFCKSRPDRLCSGKALELTRAILQAELLSLFPDMALNSDSQVVPQNANFQEKGDDRAKLEDFSGGNYQEVPRPVLKYKYLSVAGSRGRKRKYQELEGCEQQFMVADIARHHNRTSGDTLLGNMITDAMLRLGATAVHPIQALSFNYPRKTTNQTVARLVTLVHCD